MAVYLKVIGGAIFGIVSITIGLLDIFDGWPNWVLITLGTLALVAVAFITYGELMSSGSSDQPTNRDVRMTQTAGERSRQIQAQGDVYVEGGMGDEK
ncbi:hypothetical protein [Nocardia sp. XZ_19_369]|uniref:hypothetical protein n=1 Tax=Nocardia sp. XZ_19_369 TaxID=2769487 RepID=UPI0018903819|nr:hypothetical protein [Nocardia sp. XZ_19_369]